MRTTKEDYNQQNVIDSVDDFLTSCFPPEVSNHLDILFHTFTGSDTEKGNNRQWRKQISDSVYQLKELLATLEFYRECQEEDQAELSNGTGSATAKEPWKPGPAYVPNHRPNIDIETTLRLKNLERDAADAPELRDTCVRAFREIKRLRDRLGEGF